jgi:hypothetical protein
MTRRKMAVGAIGREVFKTAAAVVQDAQDMCPRVVQDNAMDLGLGRYLTWASWG